MYKYLCINFKFKKNIFKKFKNKTCEHNPIPSKNSHYPHGNCIHILTKRQLDNHTFNIEIDICTLIDSSGSARSIDDWWVGYMPQATMMKLDWTLYYAFYL